MSPLRSVLALLLLSLAVHAAPRLPVDNDDFSSGDAAPCDHGESIVRNNILFECQKVAAGVTQLRPVACAPEGDERKRVAPDGIFHTEHFHYQCLEENDQLVLKVINCVDTTGSVVEIGSFFSMVNEQGVHTTVECVGDYLKAKKTVHHWTKCQMPNGERVTEGNFHVQKLVGEKPVLQKGEILSCIRTGKEVGVKCTGCVTEHTSIHVGVSGYVQVRGQWTQCRRIRDTCRLVNVTQNYVDCQLTGSPTTYQSGTYFNDTKGISTYYCNHGVASKQGCTIEGQWALVGEVVYSAVSGEPFLCDSSAAYSTFNGLRGCDLSDGTHKRFQEVWRDNEVMKRCSWTYGAQGVDKSVVLSYACAAGNEIIAENRIFQRPDGSYHKCARNARGNLLVRPLTETEFKEHIRRKTLRLDLMEYFANGGRGRVESFRGHDDPIGVEIVPNPSGTNAVVPEAAVGADVPLAEPSRLTSPLVSDVGSSNAPATAFPPTQAASTVQIEDDGRSETEEATEVTSAPTAVQDCRDLIPYCARLISYCPDFDRQQVVDGATDDALNALVELATNEFHDINYTHPKPVVPCETNFLTHQRKMKLLVDVVCPLTCRSCKKPDEAERVINRIQKASRCG